MLWTGRPTWHPQSLGSGTCLAFFSLCRRVLPKATFVLIVVLNKTGTKLTKKPSAGKNNQNQLLRDPGMTSPPNLLPLTLETEQLAATDLDIKVLLRLQLKEHGAPVCLCEDSGWFRSKPHSACTAQQSPCHLPRG